MVTIGSTLFHLGTLVPPSGHTFFPRRCFLLLTHGAILKTNTTDLINTRGRALQIEKSQAIWLFLPTLWMSWV